MFLILVSFLFLSKKKGIQKKCIQEPRKSQIFFYKKSITVFNHVTVLLFGLSHRSCRLPKKCQETQAESLDLKLAEVRSSCNEVRIDLERHWSRQAQEPLPLMAGVQIHAMLKSWCVDMTFSALFFFLGGEYEYVYIYIVYIYNII